MAEQEEQAPQPARKPYRSGDYYPGPLTPSFSEWCKITGYNPLTREYAR